MAAKHSPGFERLCEEARAKVREVGVEDAARLSREPGALLVDVREESEWAAGHAAGVCTRDVSKAHRVARAIRAGTVWVNCYNVFSEAAPFGGYKGSGYGREQGRYSLELYTQVKTVWMRV